MTSYLAVERQDGISKIVERKILEPDIDEVILAPERVSLCGTDVQMLRGIRLDPSPILGHEGACRVIKIGKSVQAVKAGDRVVVNPTHPGDPDFLLGHNVDGLFQQQVRIPRSAVANDLLVKIDSVITSTQATLVEPLAVATYALNCLRLNNDVQRLIVIGDGLLGTIAAWYAARKSLFTEVVLAHNTEKAFSWCQNNIGDASVSHQQEKDIRDTGASTAVLITTHRDKTLQSLAHIHNSVGSSCVAIHLIGGVPSVALTPHYLGVDFNGVRAANTGGPWPPTKIETRYPNGSLISFTGNRGVTSEALAESAKELSTESTKGFEDLVTHQMSMEGGVDVMNQMIINKSRYVDGKIVMRLTLDMNPEFIY